MKNKAFNLIYCLVAIMMIGTLSNCDIINPEEDNPAYLSIPSIELITNTAGQGTNDHSITNVWVNVGEDFLGAYPIPAKIPVLMEGSQPLVVRSGIRENGIAATPGSYVFYNFYETDVDLVPGEVIDLQPTTSYVNGAVFVLEAQEGFETSSHQLQDDIDGNNGTAITICTDDVYEGIGSGKVVLTTQNSVLTVGSRLFSYIPGDNDENNRTDAFLEMNYKTDVTLLIGILGYDGIGGRVFSSVEKGVNPKDEWGKIYFNFTEEMRQLRLTTPAVTTWQFCIHAVYNAEEAGSEEAIIKLDNLKMVTF